MSNPAAKHPRRTPVVAALACGLAGFLVFQFFGNATRGYVNTPSVFWWWISQWLDPAAEAQHGWLILGLSGWVWWRNLSKPETGNRKPETGNRKPETGGRKREAGGWKPETGGWKREAGGGTGTAISEPVHGDRTSFHSGFAVSGFVAPLCAMLGALALHAIAFIGQQTRVSIVALLVFTWGVVRLAGGRRWGDAALFPLAFLVFAIPVSVLDEVGLPLRLWVTAAGEHIAHGAGIDVVRSGTQLVAPDGRFHYDVAAPCSGVRSLMALMALSLLVGYLNFRTWPRRALVFALSFPLVYVGNVARIVAIVFAAQWGGTERGDLAHAIMGYGVFAIVLGGVFAATHGVQRFWPEGTQNLPGASHEQGRRDGPAASGRAMRRSASVAAIVVAVAAAESALLIHFSRLPPRGGVGVQLANDGVNPVELPPFIGTDWIGQRVEVSAVEREILPADTGFSRKNYAFIGDRRRDVFLSIVLSGRDRTSIHRPELCLVGQGWTIERATQHAFHAGQSNDTFEATLLHVRREIPTSAGQRVVPHLVAYWFVGADAIESSHWRRFLRDAWNRMVHGRADRWAYVLMQTDASEGEAPAIARMQSVLDVTLPAFQRSNSLP